MEFTEYKDIVVRCENRVARIQINRPDKLNAIRMQTYRELISAFKVVDGLPECHLIVLEGAGGHFSAGNDLLDLVGDDLLPLMECVQGIFKTVAQLKKVLVIAVEGVAVGIGTTLLLHCDYAVASGKSKFRLPFVNLGVGPEGGSSVLLSHIIGEKRARDVLFSGRFFSADEAYNWGLINAVSEPGKASEVAEEYVRLLLQQPLASLLATKQLMKAQQPNIEDIIDNELKVFGTLLATEETRKRISMLLKK
jgi:enoyl-CoA hydratase/carnithine racemase